MSLSTSSTDKLNLRLVRASDYIENSNKATLDPEEHLDALMAELSMKARETRFDSPLWYAFNAILVEVSPAFKEQLQKGYSTEKHYSSVIKTVKENDALGPNAASLPHKFEDGLLYVVEHDDRERLCIPQTLRST